MMNPTNAPQGANAPALSAALAPAKVIPACVNGLPKRGPQPGRHPDAELLFAWDAFVNIVTAYQCAPDDAEALYSEMASDIGFRIEEYRPKTKDGMVCQLRYLLTKYIDCDDAWEVIVFGGEMTPDMKEILGNDHHAGMLWNMIDSIDCPAERIASRDEAMGRQRQSTVISALGMTFAGASTKVFDLFREHEAGTKSNPDNWPDHLVEEACEIRRAVFTTPPQTPADALAVLNLLAHDVAGLVNGDRVEAQETAVTLVRDFMKSLVGQ